MHCRGPELMCHLRVHDETLWQYIAARRCGGLGRLNLGRRHEVRVSKLTGRDDYIRVKLEEGYSF